MALDRSVPPNRAYYEACVGRWRGRLELAITDPDRLREAKLSRLDRARLSSMILSARLFGPPRFETSVVVTGPSEVVHTTRFGFLGVPTFASREVIRLDPDGTNAEITIVQRFFPLFWPARTEGPFHVEVDRAATTASYDLVFLGCPMRQTGRRDGDHVTLVQETDWMRSVQELTRFARAA